MKSKSDYINWFIGTAIYNKRNGLKMTQEVFALKCDIGRTTVTNIEQGKQCTTFLTLYNMANVLKCKIVELLPNEKDVIKNTGKKMKVVKKVTFE